MAKDTIIEEQFRWKLRQGELDFRSFPVMGIINLTPDSFYSASRNQGLDQALSQAEKHLKEGAKVLDLGAASSRPGAELLSWQEEWMRLEAPLKQITTTYPDALISVDTYRLEVAQKAADYGVEIINDISGGHLDKRMLPWLGKHGLSYIAMHMPGNPQTMQQFTQYDNVVETVFTDLKKKLSEAVNHGLSQVMVDPGFGFGKTVEDNYKLLKNLGRFQALKQAILIGLSRKSMLYKPLESTPENALNPTTAAHVLALSQMTSGMLRVHDVAAAQEAIKIVTLAQNA